MVFYKTICVFTENENSKPVFEQFASEFNHSLIFSGKNQADLMRVAKESFDLVIFEISSPSMSEIEFIDLILTVTKATPIIVVSSYFYDTKEIIFGNKIDDFILNPLTIDKLHNSISALFAKGEVLPKSTIPAETKIDDVIYTNKRLTVLLEISKSLTSIKELDELLTHIIKLTADALSSERATLFILDKEKNELWSRTGVGLKASEIRIPASFGIAGEVATSGIAQIIHDPYSHPKFNREVDLKTGFKTKNIIAYPLKNIESEVIGVIQVLNKKLGNFNSDDEKFLAALSSSIGIVLENALLQQKMRLQLEQIQQAYNELYIAQNQILKETKFATISEIIGFVKYVIRSNRNEGIMNEIKDLYSDDPDIINFLKQIKDSSGIMNQEIDSFIEQMRKDIFDS